MIRRQGQAKKKVRLARKAAAKTAARKADVTAVPTPASPAEPQPEGQA
jgi:hypothetical protein